MPEAIDKKETIDTDIQNEEEKIRHKIEIFKALSDEEQKDKFPLQKWLHKEIELKYL